MKTVGLH